MLRQEKNSTRNWYGFQSLNKKKHLLRAGSKEKEKKEQRRRKKRNNLSWFPDGSIMNNTTGNQSKHNSK